MPASSSPSILLAALLCLSACGGDPIALEDSESAADGGQAPAADAGVSPRDAAASPPALARDAEVSASLDAATSTDAGHASDATPLDASAPRDAALVDARSASSPAKDAGHVDASVAPKDAAAAPSVPCDEQLSYASFGKAFMDTYCIGCHGFKNEPLFTSLDKIEPYSSEIIERVLYETVDALHMPPYGRPQPSASERSKLESWLSCGTD